MKLIWRNAFFGMLKLAIRNVNFDDTINYYDGYCVELTHHREIKVN